MFKDKQKFVTSDYYPLSTLRQYEIKSIHQKNFPPRVMSHFCQNCSFQFKSICVLNHSLFGIFRVTSNFIYQNKSMFYHWFIFENGTLGTFENIEKFFTPPQKFFTPLWDISQPYRSSTYCDPGFSKISLEVKHSYCSKKGGVKNFWGGVKNFYIFKDISNTSTSNINH